MYIYLLVLVVTPAANPSRETQQFLINADHSTEKRKEEENGGRGVVAPANSSVFPRVPSFAPMDERAKVHVHVHVHVHVAYCLQAKHDIVYAYIIIHVQYTSKKTFQTVPFKRRLFPTVWKNFLDVYCIYMYIHHTNHHVVPKRIQLYMHNQEKMPTAGIPDKRSLLMV